MSFSPSTKCPNGATKPLAPLPWIPSKSSTSHLMYQLGSSSPSLAVQAAPYGRHGRSSRRLAKYWDLDRGSVGNTDGKRSGFDEYTCRIYKGISSRKLTVFRSMTISRLVYSMSTDCPVKADLQDSESNISQQTGYLGGSRALDALDRLITSTESLFHPSNGP